MIFLSKKNLFSVHFLNAYVNCVFEKSWELSYVVSFVFNNSMLLTIKVV